MDLQLILFAATLLSPGRQRAYATELPAVGKSAPNFSLPDQDGRFYNLGNFAAKWLVLYFYPRDDTPVCTREACAFRDDMHKIAALGAQVAGISVDSEQSHAEFAAKHRLPFPLLADDKAGVASRYGVLRNMLLFKFAKRYTFLIDPQGKVRKVYDKVETSYHSKQIIADLKTLTGGAN